MHSQEDHELMLKVKSGDLEKLGLLYERHWKQLFGFYYHMSGNSQLSEDLVQNVFIKVLKYRHSYRGEGSFDAWIFKLSRNLYYDYYNKNLKKEHSELHLTNDYELRDSGNIEVEFQNRDNAELLRLAMQKISPEKREILTLNIYQGIKFPEISKIMDCSEGAARVRAHRALNDLREVFLKLEKK
ncbi:RNA polymerase sigma factor [Flagellimonas sp. CMM7]|uniref:RNA polymerase sigma factor n=1 Tax=Flagellimonas sp. CMM7 TaxID=2654676 RepID=UPI0013D3D41C|nr:RNA polymerase sigma factor [Flagellimonas sp. CMM7]UII80084.1 RNA polymerase sigma factor [Flagellimonas sp. CMM7]